jgi:hypothetical protein
VTPTSIFASVWPTQLREPSLNGANTMRLLWPPSSERGHAVTRLCVCVHACNFTPH